MAYTVIATFDDLTEVYYVSEYNNSVRKAIENITLYGEDCIEFVFEGTPKHTLHNVSSLTNVVDRFVNDNLFEMYFDEDQKDMIDNQIKLLRKITLS